MKNTSTFQALRTKYALTRCIMIFGLLNIPWLTILFYMVQAQEILCNIFIFFYGWFCWTFIEYVIHRFWSHTKGNKSKLNSLTRHQHHHSHPTEISVNVFQRAFMFVTCLILLITGLYIHSIFFYIAGLMTGFSFFCLIHFILHQIWAERMFPALLRFHMIHHLKQPDRCFGVSVTWWDRVYKTTPASGSKISSKIITFYYGGEKDKKDHRTRFCLDESLLNDS